MIMTSSSDNSDLKESMYKGHTSPLSPLELQETAGVGGRNQGLIAGLAWGCPYSPQGPAYLLAHVGAMDQRSGSEV